MFLIGMKAQEDGWTLYQFRMTYQYNWSDMLYIADTFRDTVKNENMRLLTNVSDYMPDCDIFKIPEANQIEVWGFCNLFENGKEITVGKMTSKYAPMQVCLFKNGIMAIYIYTKWLDNERNLNGEPITDDERRNLFNTFASSLELQGMVKKAKDNTIEDFIEQLSNPDLDVLNKDACYPATRTNFNITGFVRNIIKNAEKHLGMEMHNMDIPVRFNLGTDIKDIPMDMMDKALYFVDNIVKIQYDEKRQVLIFTHYNGELMWDNESDIILGSTDFDDYVNKRKQTKESSLSIHTYKDGILTIERLACYLAYLDQITTQFPTFIGEYMMKIHPDFLVYRHMQALKNGVEFYTPFVYTDEKDKVLEHQIDADKTIHHMGENEDDKELSLRMLNSNFQDVGFPLYYSIEELRKSFPVGVARIVAVKWDDIKDYVEDTNGLVFDSQHFCPKNEIFSKYGLTYGEKGSITNPLSKEELPDDMIPKKKTKDNIISIRKGFDNTNRKNNKGDKS